MAMEDGMVEVNQPLPMHTVQFLKMSDPNRNDFFPINDSKWGSRTNTRCFFFI